MSGKQKPKNPPAFPYYSNISHYETDGMTLRDYFAAKAMQGICADGHTFWDSSIFQGDANNVATKAYELADAMLKAREQ